jgi:predicted methyltransferase
MTDVTRLLEHAVEATGIVQRFVLLLVKRAKKKKKEKKKKVNAISI